MPYEECQSTECFIFRSNTTTKKTNSILVTSPFHPVSGGFMWQCVKQNVVENTCNQYRNLYIFWLSNIWAMWQRRVISLIQVQKIHMWHMHIKLSLSVVWNVCNVWIYSAYLSSTFSSAELMPFLFAISSSTYFNLHEVQQSINNSNWRKTTVKNSLNTLGHSNIIITNMSKK